MNHLEPLKKNIISKVFCSDSEHKVIFFQKREKNRHALQCKRSCRKNNMPAKLKGLFFKHFHIVHTYVFGENRENMRRYVQLFSSIWEDS